MLLLAAGLFAARLLPESESRPVTWRDLSGAVGPLRFIGSERRIFRERRGFSRYLTQTSVRPPAVDFSRRQVLLVSPGPRSSTGYDLEVLEVTERDEEITVRVRERTPPLGERVEPRVTYPYRLLSLPARRDVFVDWVGR